MFHKLWNMFRHSLYGFNNGSFNNYITLIIHYFIVFQFKLFCSSCSTETVFSILQKYYFRIFNKISAKTFSLYFFHQYRVSQVLNFISKQSTINTISSNPQLTVSLKMQRSAHFKECTLRKWPYLDFDIALSIKYNMHYEVNNNEIWQLYQNVGCDSITLQLIYKSLKNLLHIK